nr:nickel pincer cofactor biosynthesis protein LarC [Clostridium sp. Marseille-P7770]
MKTLYFDCGMGAAGDMLMASLYEICPDKAGFLKTMNAMGLPGLSVEAEPAVKCGITGTHMKVTIHGEEEESVDVDLQEHVHDHAEHHEHANNHHEHCHDHEAAGNHHHHEAEVHHHEMAADMADNTHIHAYDHDHQPDHNHHDEHDFHHTHTHEETHTEEHSGHPHHHHTSMAGISHIIEHLNLPDEVKKDVVAVYHLIAEAESHVHGKTVEEIHFHEVGTADAIADIAGVCLLMHMIAPQKVIASPIHVGSGNVRCAHGILPVPAPATAFILQGLPIYSGVIKGELCTPTGAALLKHFVTEFKEMPVMRTLAIGYGMGKKDFERANCVRVLLGETEETGSEVAELSCNLDDMTPEALGFVQEILFAAGALEVYTIPIGMKKSRPGILLTCMCRCNDKEKMVSLIFKHTTTLGIRESISKRYTLTRTMKEHETPYGVVREKVSEGYGVVRGKLEYEDLAKIAREQGMSLEEVKALVENE